MSRARTLSLGTTTSRKSVAPFAVRPGLLLLLVFIVLCGFIAVALGLLVLAFGVLKLGALVASA